MAPILGCLIEVGIIPAGSVNTTRLEDYGSTLKAGIALDLWSLPREDKDGDGTMEGDNLPYIEGDSELDDEDSC